MMLSVKITMNDLDDWANHLPDLIVQKWLTFQVKFDKLNCFRVLRRCDFKAFFVYIHVLVCWQIHHVPLRSCLSWLHIFGVVMVWFCAHEGIFEQSVNPFFLFIR
jgi:hypothetical protein